MLLGSCCVSANGEMDPFFSFLLTTVGVVKAEVSNDCGAAGGDAGDFEGVVEDVVVVLVALAAVGVVVAVVDVTTEVGVAVVALPEIALTNKSPVLLFVVVSDLNGDGIIGDGVTPPQIGDDPLLERALATDGPDRETKNKEDKIIRRTIVKTTGKKI
jgi:hypothetical protein